ncbi:MAG: hypothetical protein LZT29_04361 (plasmid) [Pantoea stewartii]|uniref:hypothetical protein n=1 Tax=Pantoea stewartii TaxID=66269 RepID=UPI000AA6C2AA|nr:hypothetical protein [Pantoea stewartii]WHT01215.1 MAG: hypothetical protein LZT29_04361 [Pantoea stewartii]
MRWSRFDRDVATLRLNRSTDFKRVDCYRVEAIMSNYSAYFIGHDSAAASGIITHLLPK